MEVNQALGPAKDDYLEAGRKMTKDNKAVFGFRKITKAEVEKQIRAVGNKESFGNRCLKLTIHMFYIYIRGYGREAGGTFFHIQNFNKQKAGSCKLGQLLMRRQHCDFSYF